MMMIRPNAQLCFYGLLMLLALFNNPVVDATAPVFEELEILKHSLFRRELLSASPTPVASQKLSRVYHVTSYGADPTGQNDSTDAILEALSDIYNNRTSLTLISGISDLGGAQLHLDGGVYTVSRPLRFPNSGVGNVVIQGGTIRASDTFPGDQYIIDLTPPPRTGVTGSYNYELVTLRDLLLDSNFRGGGISVTNSLRISIDNCYVTHFTSIGIISRSGHETYIRNSFLGQRITAGGDSGERTFTGTAISLAGNDNSVTDVVIFSAAIGVLVTGQANLLTGVHCYNKAAGFGGIGILVKLPGLTQTRIVNCYLDYNGIVAEDPVQLLIANSFFLGDGNVLLKSVNGVVNGVNIVDNQFSGSDKGVNIVQLDQSSRPFTNVRSVVVDRNVVRGMQLRSTVGKGSVYGNGTSWAIDFDPVLLFPNRIDHVQFSVLVDSGGSFPVHVLRNVSNNGVIVESNVAVSTTVYVSVEQGIN